MLLIKNFLLGVVRFWVCIIVLTPTAAGAQDTGVSSSASAGQSVVLKWLGNAGWEIQIGPTAILIDPFLTRGEANPSTEWKTDEEAVLRAIKRADYIFAAHSHADHIADLPFIAKKFGSKVIGSRTTTNIAITAGVDKTQLVTISGGEKLDFKEFSVQVIESEHAVLRRGGRSRRPRSEEITEPWSGPILGKAFVEGGSFLYLFTFGNHRLLHQSTGGFIEDKLTGLKADTALLYPMDRSDLADIVKALQPKTVFIHHFDEWRTAFSAGIPGSNSRRAERAQRDIGSVDKGIKVVIPKFFESHSLP